MGGPGSGNWYRFDRRTTVEEAWLLAVGTLRGRIRPGSAGTVTWSRDGKRRASVGYFVTREDDRFTVWLHYRWRDREDIEIPIRLQTTRTQFGGQRWWFTCPLIVGGMACRRRVGKLYLPPGARYFGCRRCHGLTYRSCQEAHQEERLFGQLGREMGFDAEIGRLLAARLGRCR
ncbi:MAG: hypothetical protein JW809_19230 [Pirellulales bacterium]|nr:hypothetical protein [Pirellulales bacterium]